MRANYMHSYIQGVVTHLSTSPRQTKEFRFVIFSPFVPKNALVCVSLVLLMFYWWYLTFHKNARVPENLFPLQ